ncbi:MAG: cysteine desulfurase family protein [Fimbriimonadaceae bacterium]
MIPRNRYFDHAASTPLDPEVREAMVPWFGGRFGNAHSIHQAGLEAADAIERARESVAFLIGAESPEQVFFTSGATESNNWIALQSRTLSISPFEHSSMRAPALRHGATLLPNEGWSLREPLPNVECLAIIGVHNETGTIFPAISPERTHRDATQELGKTAIRVAESGVASLSLSAHKIYGPQGVGALYVRAPYSLTPLILGGDQERRMRGGTLNVAGIVGLGAAARLAADRFEEDLTHAKELSSQLEQAMTAVSDVQRVGGDMRSPYIHGYVVNGVLGEALVIGLDAEGFAVSSGAACSSHSEELSPSLLAAGTDEASVRSFIRVSLGREHTQDDIDAFTRTFRKVVNQLRSN